MTKNSNEAADNPVSIALGTHRQGIDRLDGALVFLLAERFAITDEVGRIKAESGFPALDADREAEQRARLRALAADAGVDPALVEPVFDALTATVRARHEQIRRSTVGEDG